MNQQWLSVALLLNCVASNSAAPPITAAAFTPDGRQVLLGSQAGIEIRNWPDLKKVANVKTELQNLHDLSFAPDGKTLLAAGGSPAESGIVEVFAWPAATCERSIREHRDLVYRVAWSPQVDEFVTASADGSCQVFKAASGKQVARYEGHSRAVLAVAYLTGEQIVSAGVDQTLQLWESQTGKPIRTLDNHLAAINELAVRPGRKSDSPPVVVSVSDDRTVRFWQPTIGRLMRFARLEVPARCVAWSGDGQHVFVGCHDGRIKCIDVDTLSTTELQLPNSGRLHVLLAVEQELLTGGEGGAFVLPQTRVTRPFSHSR